jgi:hypothetical protein
MFRHTARRSLPESLTRAVVKPVAVTFARLLSYVSTSVVTDMSVLADGHQTTQLK